MLCPGRIPSKHDRDWHFVSARQLARLYGVSMRECVISDGGPQSYSEDLDLIRLHPRFDGKYQLPEA